MKRILLIPLIIMLAGTLVISGCAQPGSDMTEELEGKGTSLLVVLNAPLEWGGRVRIGTFYTVFGIIKAAALSESYDSVALYFGPESTDYTAVGELEAMAAPMFPEGENLAEVSRYLKNELGVNFYAPIGSIQHHELTVEDFITPISEDEFVQITASAEKIVGF